MKGGRPTKSEEVAKGKYRSLTGREKLYAIKMIGELTDSGVSEAKAKQRV